MTKDAYQEEIEHLPEIDTIVAKPPDQTRCIVCGHPEQDVVNSTCERVKKKIDEGKWVATYETDYKKATLKPCPEKHAICRRIEETQQSQIVINSHLRAHLQQLEESQFQVLSTLETRRRSLLKRTLHRLGSFMHRMGSKLQRGDDE